MSTPSRVAAPVFDHLDRLTDGRGLFEHACYDAPRPEHGYCVDDVARALVVVCREADPSRQMQRLTRHYLRFTASAVHADGACHNRMSTDGHWRDEPALGDWWGRALWGFGVAAVHAPTEALRAGALLAFRSAARRRSPHRRSMVFAGLGAAELLLHSPNEIAAQYLVCDAVEAVGADGSAADWPWPEPRLSYGNGSVVELLLLAGSALHDALLHARGLRLLDFLLRTETHDGHLSVTPVLGRGPGETGPAFDQQPIEVAALADACARAYGVTEDRRWLDAVGLAWGWFCGDNDSRTPMFDARTGGGFDGLEAGGHNRNQGAESTLAMLSTAQHARRLGVLG
jgi:hypothetical protein